MIERFFRSLKEECVWQHNFKTFEHARGEVDRWIRWYNAEHRHSAIRFVTPDERHSERAAEILAKRDAVYTAARERHPERWTGNTRDWTPAETAVLNPTNNTPAEEAA